MGDTLKPGDTVTATKALMTFMATDDLPKGTGAARPLDLHEMKVMKVGLTDDKGNVISAPDLPGWNWLCEQAALELGVTIG